MYLPISRIYVPEPSEYLSKCASSDLFQIVFLIIDYQLCRTSVKMQMQLHAIIIYLFIQMASDMTLDLGSFGSHRSTPCLQTYLQRSDIGNTKNINPMGIRTFTRKPQISRNAQGLRNRKKADQARELASFFSPQAIQKIEKHVQSTSTLPQRPLADSSYANMGSQQPSQKSANATFVKVLNNGLSTPVNYKKERQVAGGGIAQLKATLAADTQGKHQQPLNKKVRILQIQLQALTLQNSRLKEHLSLIRTNYEELKQKCNKKQANRKDQTERTVQSALRLQELQCQVEMYRRKVEGLKEQLSKEKQQIRKLNQKLYEKSQSMAAAVDQLEFILALNKQENHLLRVQNQQLNIRIWNFNKRFVEIKAAQKQRRMQAVSLKKRTNNYFRSKRMSSAQYTESEDELFELSPQRA